MRLGIHQKQVIIFSVLSFRLQRTDFYDFSTVTCNIWTAKRWRLIASCTLKEAKYEAEMSMSGIIRGENVSLSCFNDVKIAK